MSLFQRSDDSTWRSPLVTLCRVLHHVSLSVSKCADNVDLRALLGQRTCILLNNNGLFLKMSRGFFFIFYGEVGICIHWIFQCPKHPKNYHRIESAHSASAVIFSEVLVMEPSMPVHKVKVEHKVHTPWKCKYYGLMSCLSSRLHHILKITEVSRREFHSFPGHQMGRKSLFCHFKNLLTFFHLNSTPNNPL